MTLDNILKEVEPILSGKDVFQFTQPSFQEILTAEYFFKCISEGDSLVLSIKISRKILEFIAEMNPPKDKLYDLIYSTRKMDRKKCGLLGGNCATLLAILGEDLRHKDFSGTNINGANLADCNLEGIILRKAIIETASFSYSNLYGVDKHDVDRLRSRFLEGPLDPVLFEGKSIYLINVLGSLIEWNFEHGEVRRMKTYYEPHVVRERCLSPARGWFVDLREGVSKVFNLKSGKEIFVEGLSDLKDVSSVAFSEDGLYFAVAQYFEELFYSKVTLTDLRGRREQFELVPKEPSPPEPGVFSYGKVSNLNFCFKYFACDTYSGRGDESVLASTKVFERLSSGGWEHFLELNSNQNRENFRSRSVFSPDSNHIAAHGVIYSLNDDSQINLSDELRRLSLMEYSSSGLFELPFYSLKPHFFSFDNRYLVMSGYPDEGQMRIFAYDMKTKKVFDLYCAKYRPGPGTDLMVSKDGRRVAFSGARRNSADLVTAICSLDFKRKELVPLYEIRGEYSMEQYFKA